MRLSNDLENTYRGVRFFVWSYSRPDEWFWSIGHKETNFFNKRESAAEAVYEAMCAIDREIWTRYGD